jgi:hypothetical protein
VGRQIQEARLNIGAYFRTGGEDADACVVGKLIHVLLCHFSCLIESSIGLVANDNDGDIVVGMLLDLFNPGVQVQERVPFEQVEHKDDPVGSAVVSIRDSSVPLLASCVPLICVTKKRLTIWSLIFFSFRERLRNL